MNLLIDDAIVIAVAGLLTKEGVMAFIKYRAKKNYNHNGNGLRGLLEDIRGQGKLTLDKVGGIEKEQAEIKLNLMKAATEMVGFKEKCVAQDKKIDELDCRLFDHIKAGG
jgi:hypothetical protein